MRYPTRGAPALFIEEAVKYKGDDCLLWPFYCIKGYACIGTNGKRRKVHRTVCERVHGTAPFTDHEVAHSCGNPSCIAPNHLRWASHSENMKDAVLHGTIPSKLTPHDVAAIMALKGSVSQRQLASRFGVAQSTIGRAKRYRALSRSEKEPNP